jgi:hypothetical protein
MKLRHFVNQNQRLEILTSEEGGDERVLMLKVEQLRGLLSDQTIDQERTVFGTEPIYKSILTETERRMVQRKLFELIQKF